jgi:hypothetical protein
MFGCFNEIANVGKAGGRERSEDVDGERGEEHPEEGER